MSHKFTIEIELEDGRFCDGCPCRHAYEYGGSPECQNEKLFILGETLQYNPQLKTIRPQPCLDKYGPGEEEK